MEDQPPPAPPSIILPPVPPQLKKKPEQLPLRRIFISKINITGSTVFSLEELDAITTPYVNRELTAEDLEELRRQLTLLYVEKGYINSGAILPDQTIVDDTITLQVVEGKLTNIEVEGLRWFRPHYIEDRLTLDASYPLNVTSLQQRLKLLQQDPRIERLNAELKPGIKPGESELNVKVKERTPYKFWLKANNYQSPSVGAERGEAILAHQNLTGHGDALSFSYGRSEGIDPQIDTLYSFPLTSRDTTLILNYRKNDYVVVEEPFDRLDVASKSEIMGVTLKRPFYRTLNQEFVLALTGEYLRQETFLLGERFSFTLGPEDGVSVVTVLRFSQTWTYRTQTQVVATRSRLNWGVNALGSTINDDTAIPDSRFISWQGQFQWARRLGIWGTQVNFRTDLQLADDRLLSLEKMAVGGRYSVRGYRENQMVRDTGLIASLEFRMDLVSGKPWADIVQLVTFVDYGWARDKYVSTSYPRDISSVGLGLEWAVRIPPPLRLEPQFEIYWGTPLGISNTPSGISRTTGFIFN